MGFLGFSPWALSSKPPRCPYQGQSDLHQGPSGTRGGCCWAHLSGGSSTWEPVLLQVVELLVDFPLLELADDFHVLLADGVVLEVVELGGVVGEVEQVDLALVLLVELVDVGLHIEVMAALLPNEYLDYRTIFYVSSFFDCPATHFSTYYCFIFIVFSCSLNFFSCAFTRLKNSAFLAPNSELNKNLPLISNNHIIKISLITIFKIVTMAQQQQYQWTNRSDYSNHGIQQIADKLVLKQTEEEETTNVRSIIDTLIAKSDFAMVQFND